MSLLSINISADYAGKPAVLRDVSLEVGEGEIVGLVGRSGEGKSTIAMSILGLLSLKGGSCRGNIRFRGRDLLKLTNSEMRRVRGKEIGLVPQSPLAALNPNMKLGAQLEEAWRAHERGARDWMPLLESVSLPAEPAFLRQRPRNLSVGLAQRFLIAMAILHRPALLLADEPTSALDMITQAEILRLFASLNRATGVAMLYISHDLASVASLCHRVAILHSGEIVECAPTADVFRNPRHPYTQKLIAAIPRFAHERDAAGVF
ncbi:MAG: ABC transporter ATP-binding protein [Bryobacteraceae bacterium]|jgi:ABC-type glutathione transport system ATPase component